MERRSRSSSNAASARHPDPYHAVSEVYTKEVTHRPIGPVSEFPPEILNILREEPRAPHSPPLVRSRENTWTPENFPIVRVPSAKFSDFMEEVYDYHEVEKYTRRSVTPEPLRKQEEVGKAPPPTYQVIPPTPEKNTPRYPSGIPLTSSDPAKKPLPMYEEYVKMQQNDVENRNTVLPPRSPSTVSNNNQLRYIDSSSSSESFSESRRRPDSESMLESRRRNNPDGSSLLGIQNFPRNSEDVKIQNPIPSEKEEKRYVYTHDVYVDSATGRPFTPGREDVKGKKNCDKLKINVYFKPPHPPVEETYKLDEIEIEKHEDVTKLRPFEESILSRRVSSNPSVLNPSEMDHRRIPTRTSVLRKEHEILTVPLNRSQSVRQSRISEHSTRRSASKTTERSVPVHLEDTSSINMDDVFPKVQHRLVAHPPPPQSRSSTRSHVAESIDKGDLRRVAPVAQYKPVGTAELQFTRGITKTPSVKEDVKSERSPSFLSHAPSQKTDRTDVRIPVTVTKTKRQSPEELDYGRYQNGQPEKVGELPYTRGISKTPSDQAAYRNPTVAYSNPERDQKYSNPSSVHIPFNNAEKEKAFQQAKSLPSARSSYRSHQTNKSIAKSDTPELPYTRGISKTPSDLVYSNPEKYSNPKSMNYSNPSTVHIPFNNPEKERAHQQATQPSPKRAPRPHTPPKRVTSPSAKTRSAPGPYEEIVHIKERYERDETIRRFFPTTTTV